MLISALLLRIGRADNILTSDLREISSCYFIDPSSPTSAADPHRFYLNLYTDSAGNADPLDYYECRYYYESTVTGSGWHRTVITSTTTAVPAKPKKAGIECAPSFGGLPAGRRAISYALNGGDTSTDDGGLKGGFDAFTVRTAARTTTYDLEPTPTPPATGCAGTAGAPQAGTSRNDNLRGTAGADRINGKDGNDNIDGRGGDDCLLGGDGNNRLGGGAADEIQGGPDNDMINGEGGADVISGGAGNDQIKAGAGDDKVDAGAGDDIVDVRSSGVDTVDCGAGKDIVLADRNDKVDNNGEVQQR